jgi:hypothetical protein
MSVRLLFNAANECVGYNFVPVECSTVELNNVCQWTVQVFLLLETLHV